MQVSSHLSQQEMQFVADDVDLLFGLHAVLSGGLQEQLGGDLLQRGDLSLAAPQLRLQSLQGATESTGLSDTQTVTSFEKPIIRLLSLRS